MRIASLLKAGSSLPHRERVPAPGERRMGHMVRGLHRVIVRSMIAGDGMILRLDGHATGECKYSNSCCINYGTDFHGFHLFLVRVERWPVVNVPPIRIQKTGARVSQASLFGHHFLRLWHRICERIGHRAAAPIVISESGKYAPASLPACAAKQARSCALPHLTAHSSDSHNKCRTLVSRASPPCNKCNALVRKLRPARQATEVARFVCTGIGNG